jgi:hypothetical protein
VEGNLINTEVADRAFTDVTQTITVDLVDLPLIVDKISALNKRAARLGVPAITYVEVARDSRPDSKQSDWEDAPDIATVTIDVVGHTPVLPGGWKFVGSIEHLGLGPDGVNVNLVHGDDVRLETWRLAGPGCDHCKIDRRRSKTIILQSADGNLVQVGSTCIKDFLGYHKDPTVLWKAIEELGDDDFWDLGDKSGSYGIDVLKVLTAAAAAIRANGWWSKSNETTEVATASLASYLLRIARVPTGNRGPSADEIHFGRTKVTEVDVAKAREVLDWVLALPDDRKTTSYILNLATVASVGVVERKHIGLVVSAQSAMERDLESVAKAAAQAERKVATLPAGRVEIEGVIKSGRYQLSAYGETYKVVIECGDAEAGYFKVWGTLASSLEDAQIGDTVRFTATVESSLDDKAFGFFKRPAKGEIVKKGE